MYWIMATELECIFFLSFCYLQINCFLQQQEITMFSCCKATWTPPDISYRLWLQNTKQSTAFLQITWHPILPLYSRILHASPQREVRHRMYSFHKNKGFEILTAVTTALSWIVFFRHEVWRYFRNVFKHLQDYTGSHPRRQDPFPKTDVISY
jgi:hypothetical protein